MLHTYNRNACGKFHDINKDFFQFSLFFSFSLTSYSFTQILRHFWIQFSINLSNMWCGCYLSNISWNTTNKSFNYFSSKCQFSEAGIFIFPKVCDDVTPKLLTSAKKTSAWFCLFDNLLLLCKVSSNSYKYFRSYGVGANVGPAPALKRPIKSWPNRFE